MDVHRLRNIVAVFTKENANTEVFSSKDTISVVGGKNDKVTSSSPISSQTFFFQ